MTLTVLTTIFNLLSSKLALGILAAITAFFFGSRMKSQKSKIIALAKEVKARDIWINKTKELENVLAKEKRSTRSARAAVRRVHHAGMQDKLKELTDSDPYNRDD